MAAIQSLIFNGKEEAIEYLYDIDLNQKIDGQQFMARYYDGNHKIASVIGPYIHSPNENNCMKSKSSYNVLKNP